MHPATVVEAVVVLLQHQHLTLIPALVVRTHVLYPQGGLAVQSGAAWWWSKQDRDEEVRRTEG